MRALLISVLAATLIGCACLAPQDPLAFKVAAQNTESASAANTQNPPSAQFGKKTDPVAKGAKHTIAGKMRPLPSAQSNDKADPVIEKAKATIAAMMENPASAEFGEMKRAVRNVLGESIDTICGYVKGKNASGGDTGEFPFLYIIQHDEAYIVDGSSAMAATAYRNLCK
jgi:hypothetical protein